MFFIIIYGNIMHKIVSQLPMNILILSAFPEEQDYYKRTLQPCTSCKIAMIDVLQCQIANGVSVYLATTGMGTINAAITLSTLAAHLQLTAVFFSGTAGAIDPNLNIGDIVIGQDAFDADILSVHDAVLNTPFESALINPNRQDKTPKIYTANQTLLQISLAASNKQAGSNPLPQSKIWHGRIATSNHFPAPKEVFAQIKEKNAVIIDMESAAIYQFSWLSQLPVLVVRGVSNKLDHHGVDKDVSSSDIRSSDHAAKLVLDCIESMLPRSISA